MAVVVGRGIGGDGVEFIVVAYATVVVLMGGRLTVALMLCSKMRSE